MNRELDDVAARLRDATNAFTDELEISHDAWARLRGRLDREPSRRGRAVRVGAGFAIAGALAAAAIATVVALSHDTDGGLRVETPPATQEPGPVTPPLPGVAYATQDDEIVVLDANGNEVQRRSASVAGMHIAGLQVIGASDDAKFATLQLGDGARCGSLALTGPGELAAPFVEGEVAAFAYSPDGTRLATATGCVSQLEFLVVRPVDGGEQQVWAHEPGLDDDLPLHVDSIAWSPDGTRLAVGLCYESCSIALIDPTTSGRLIDAPTLAVGRYPTWLDDHRVAFLEGPESDAGPPEAHDVRWVDADTGAFGVPLADLGATTVASLEADAASGLLMLRFETGDVAVWDGKDMRPILSGARAATFVHLAARD